MWVFLLGMLGFPLTGGFVGKFYVFAAAYDSGLLVADRRRRGRDDGLGLLLPRRSSGRCTSATRVELQLAPAGGSPPRELLLGARRRCLRRRHGRLVLRRAAADRRGALGRGRSPAVEARSTASRAAAPGAAGTARRRAASLSPNTTRQATSAEAPSGGSVCVWAAGERAAHESTRSARARPQRSDWSPASEPARCSRYSPKQMSAVTAVNGTAASSASNARPCAPRASAAAATHREQSRKRSTSHEHLASPSSRTVLLCSRRPETRRKGTSDGDIDLARARVLPARHRRRQAHLRRPVAERTDLPRLRARARAGRRDRSHPRARRPRRRRGRAPAEARLQGDRDGRADGLARGERRPGRRRGRVQQGRHASRSTASASR